MDNKEYRMRELFNPGIRHSLVVDTSRGLVLGALPGLGDFETVVQSVLPLIDSIVTSPGQSQRLGKRTRQDAALIVRGDWTNALRGKDFVLPPETIQYIPILDATDALELGANALVMHFLLGHEEEIEAACLKRVVTLAMEGLKLGTIEAKYVDYSDDGLTFLNGTERSKTSFVGESSYEADLKMTGAQQGEMRLRMTFSKISFTEPCKLLFDPAEDGKPKSQGYVRYNGVEMNVEDMLE